MHKAIIISDSDTKHPITGLTPPDKITFILCNDLKKTIEAISIDLPAFILIDISSMKFDPYKMAEDIRENRPYSKIPLVFTGNAHDPRMSTFKGAESGLVEFIKRPYRGQDIQFKIGILTTLQDTIRISVTSAKLASLGEMAAGVAHEVHNPLTMILGVLDLLPMIANNKETFEKKIEVIRKSCLRIEKIVNGLRKISRAEEKKKFVKCRLKDIINEAISLVEVKAKTEKVPFSFECTSDVEIECDEMEIEQVLINLFNNAIDAISKLSEKWVKIKVFEENDEVIVHILDSGKGIDEKVKNKLFDPFFTTKEVGKGTGLGLSISKGILAEHNAQLDILSSCPNTCFEIRFPRSGVRQKLSA